MRKKIVIITLSSILLVGIIVAAVVGTTINNNNNNNNDNINNANNLPVSASLKVVCDETLYPDSCHNSLSPLVNSSNAQPVDFYKLSLHVAIDELSRISSQIFTGNNGVLQNNIVLSNCRELLDLAIDHLNNSISVVDLTSLDTVDDLKTWLSAAGTYQQTCIDGYFGNNHTIVSNYLKNSTEFTSNSLAILNDFTKFLNSLKLRRLLSDETPSWVSSKDRKLLQSNTKIKADFVVAKDGSGTFKTITDALKKVPEKSKKRIVIYVKTGVYNENVRIETSMWNVMMIGDGMDKTVVSGGLNFVDGTPTFSSATFAIFGRGFIAQGMGFRNTAGPSKQQAVALMSTADQSIFYKCRFDAFQDTLYTHSNRQFYRECNIYGTVDFIFGNSAVVFQNSNILPKLPVPGQQNTITAQGKFDPNQNTGISIQNCTIWPAANLSSVQTFLGRPWKNYSTTVYMHNMMGSLIDPKGWLPWVGDDAPSTIFYAEFQNYGPGSSTQNRVKWKGLRTITSKIASKFTVKQFINGDKWIKAAGVNYNPSL